MKTFFYLLALFFLTFSLFSLVEPLYSFDMDKNGGLEEEYRIKKGDKGEKGEKGDPGLTDRERKEVLLFLSRMDSIDYALSDSRKSLENISKKSYENRSAIISNKRDIQRIDKKLRNYNNELMKSNGHFRRVERFLGRNSIILKQHKQKINKYLSGAIITRPYFINNKVIKSYNVSKTGVLFADRVHRIEGFANGKIGQMIYVMNCGEKKIEIIKNSKRGKEKIRFSGTTAWLKPDEGVVFIYDGKFWRPLGLK